MSITTTKGKVLEAGEKLPFEETIEILAVFQAVRLLKPD
jgi:hypothetical protein